MPNLMAMSFEGEHAPSLDLRCLRTEKRPDGWGLGWYPGGEQAASVLKEPAPPAASIRSELVRAWEHLESSLFIMHIRRATWGHNSDANTQPYLRSWGGRDWLFCHSGSLDHRLEQEPWARFIPVGSTDSELIFCELLNWAFAKGWKSLGEFDMEALREWFDKMNGNGSATMVLSDGHDLCVYADRSAEQRELFVCEVRPPYGRLVFGDADLEVNLTQRGVKSHKGVIISTTPLMPPEDTEGQEQVDPAFNWWRMQPGHLVVIRRGAIRAVVPRPESPAEDQAGEGAEERAGGDEASVSTFTPVQGVKPETRPRRHDFTRLLNTQAQVKRLEVLHRTAYRYANAVERSVHTLRLEPVHDLLQHTIEHHVHISVDCKKHRYEDVFGNKVWRLDVTTPYKELIIESYSKVELRDTTPLEPSPHVRTTIPLIWMPWQRHMLQPYLLPPELPETQLAEITDYAMSFVKRNDYDLLETLMDMNLSIFREYQYRQGSTTLATTPFDVYVTRRGVCQDFANLFICMARMLSIPARYVCGYIYTGPKNTNKIQSEASHAWVELYLPEIGWKGFDPTNGILVQTDHVRVAHGRTYVDATPTAGTIFVGGGPETLEVLVRCEPCD